MYQTCNRHVSQNILKVYFKILLAFLFLYQNTNAFYPEKWGCKIGFVDLRDFVQEEIQNYENIQNCDRDLMDNNLTISEEEGVFTLQNPFYQASSVARPLGAGSQQKQHGSGPLLAKLLKTSDLSPDWKQADVVFVYDFCIKYPTSQSLDENYQYILKTGYNRLMQTEKWQTFGGQNFLFIVSHPMEAAAERYRCLQHKTANAIYAFTEWKMACGIRPHNILIPYLTNDIIRDDKGFHRRENLMCFIGHSRINSVSGIRLRYYLMQQLQNKPETLFLKNSIPHSEVMQMYQNCKYCFVASGDTLSSRRLGEVILGGCIPVFVGPPFHNIWFEHNIHYNEFSIFLYIKNRQWDFRPDERNADNEVVEFVVPGEANMYELKNITEIDKFLRNFPQEKAFRKYERLLHHQSAFEYFPNPHGYPSAFDHIMRHSCNVYNKLT